MTETSEAGIGVDAGPDVDLSVNDGDPLPDDEAEGDLPEVDGVAPAETADAPVGPGKD